MLDQLTVYIRTADRILARWDAYSGTHTDAQGWPLNDHAYGLRQRRRDSDTWHAFEPVRAHMADILIHAVRHFAALPDAERTTGWLGGLTLLDEARIGLDYAQTTWEIEHNALQARAGFGSKAYAEALAERNAEAWGHMCTWADHGHVLIDLAKAAARKTPGAVPSPEHARAQDHTVPPPQGPGRRHDKGPR